MGIVRFGHGFNATPASSHNNFEFAAPQRDAVMSRSSISGFPRRDADHDEIAQIAIIHAIFESARDWPTTIDGNRQCEKCMSGSAIPNLPLPARSYHVAARQMDSPTKHERSKKVISLKAISEKLDAWRRYRVALRQLSQLSDHDLSDIGIGRGDIEYVARRPVASKPSA